jgi:MFS family permease
MNKIVKILTISDCFIYFGIGLISPILSVFITKNITGGTLAAAGLAAGLFLLIKSIFQLIFAEVFGFKDRFNMLIAGTLMLALTPMIYLFSLNIYYIYAAQAVYGIGAALISPAWLNLFTLNVNKKKPGFEWSVYISSLGICMGIAGYLGAWLAAKFGFSLIFILNGIFILIGVFILFGLYNLLNKRKRK